MASQTKVEPVEQQAVLTPPAAAEGAVIGSGEDDVEDHEPANSAIASSAIASDDPAVADDEDVSMDELLISDNLDEDEQEDATEVHEGLHRVAMQELGLMQDPEAMGEASAAAEDSTPEPVADANSHDVIPPVSEEREAVVAEAERAFEPS